MKPRPGHWEYLKVLRRMSPQQRLKKAFEMTKQLFKQGLRQRFPNLSEDDLHQLSLERQEKCHTRNW